MRGGLLAQAHSSKPFRPFPALFRFVFTLNPTFYKCSLLKYSHPLASLTRALIVVVAEHHRSANVISEGSALVVPEDDFEQRKEALGSR
jgi:hypothetical protein